MQHLIKSSQYYLYKNDIKDKFIRFDVIEILIENKKRSINHIPEFSFEMQQKIHKKVNEQ